MIAPAPQIDRPAFMRAAVAFQRVLIEKITARALAAELTGELNRLHDDLGGAEALIESIKNDPAQRASKQARAQLAIDTKQHEAYAAELRARMDVVREALAAADARVPGAIKRANDSGRMLDELREHLEAAEAQEGQATIRELNRAEGIR
jgi:hypothetical protein